MQDTCAAGVRYADVKDPHRQGLEQYPCFKDVGCPERCASASFLSPQEVAEKEREAGEALNRYLTNIANDICPHCEHSIKEKRQVGRCVYGYPCGHRLYQGTLPKKEKTWQDHPYFRESP